MKFLISKRDNNLCLQYFGGELHGCLDNKLTSNLWKSDNIELKWRFLNCRHFFILISVIAIYKHNSSYSLFKYLFLISRSCNLQFEIISVSIFADVKRKRVHTVCIWHVHPPLYSTTLGEKNEDFLRIQLLRFT